MKIIIKSSLYAIIIAALILTGCHEDKVPDVSTNSALIITPTSSLIGGKIINSGSSSISDCGLCWSTDPGPTIADNFSSANNRSGNFSSVLTNLEESTKYYARAYASNNAGTAYGSELIFTTSGTITDIDNNIYYTVSIGTQVWMKENLRTARYRNGEPIGTTVPLTLDISKEINSKYQWFVDEGNNNANIYGRVYTWYAVNDIRNICPTGWHVPYDSEWTTLVDFLTRNNFGYTFPPDENWKIINDIGKSLASQTGWKTSSDAGSIGKEVNLNNLSGFSALPSTSRDVFGGSSPVGDHSSWWTASENTYLEAWGRFMYFNKGNLANNSFDKRIGFSVRCLKDL
jgi:uncharacterized protein (TIGR02145 family)